MIHFGIFHIFIGDAVFCQGRGKHPTVVGGDKLVSIAAPQEGGGVAVRDLLLNACHIDCFGRGSFSQQVHSGIRVGLWPHRYHGVDQHQRTGLGKVIPGIPHGLCAKACCQMTACGRTPDGIIPGIQLPLLRSFVNLPDSPGQILLRRRIQGFIPHMVVKDKGVDSHAVQLPGKGLSFHIAAHHTIRPAGTDNGKGMLFAVVHQIGNQFIVIGMVKIPCSLFVL